MPIAPIPGGSLHYQLAGQPLNQDRPPVVLLLPQSSGPVGLVPFIDQLAAHHTIITYDQRGTGGSSPMPDAMSMATQAMDVVALLDVLEVEHATLLCHSTGCGIGISTAAAHPDRITRLILASPWTHADPHLTTMQNLRIAAARALAPTQYAHFNAALLFPPGFRRTYQTGFDQLAANAPAKPQNADEIARRLNAILAFDARPLLPSIQCQAVAITARDDQLMPSWFAAEAAHLIPNASLLELDGGGHMILETRASDIIEVVLPFLK
ncbi:MAG: alpha/beta fold hydrolase [Hyphomicrobiaceae bacterium]